MDKRHRPLLANALRSLPDTCQTSYLEAIGRKNNALSQTAGSLARRSRSRVQRTVSFRIVKWSSTGLSIMTFLEHSTQETNVCFPCFLFSFQPSSLDHSCSQQWLLLRTIQVVRTLCRPKAAPSQGIGLACLARSVAHAPSAERVTLPSKFQQIEKLWEKKKGLQGPVSTQTTKPFFLIFSICPLCFY